MPFYDLKCKNCNHKFNVYASISKSTGNKIRCPECGGFEHNTIFNDKPNVYKKDKNKHFILNTISINIILLLVAFRASIMQSS